jgi:hypothetical protein
MPRAAALHPALTEESTRLRRNWNQNGAWLDQGPYGTCVGNAFAHRRADGPLLIDGIDEPFAQKLYLEASAYYWGEPDTTMQKGTSGLSACQALVARGAIDRYEWITSFDALRYTLLERGSVCVGCTWYWSMFDPDPVQGPDGTLWQEQYYMKVNFTSRVAGGHEFLINGIDLDPLDGMPPYYRMKNSWGRGWGKNGTARFKLEDLDALLFGSSWGDCVLIHELPRTA